MAHEKLIIKNFIGIKDLELEINRFNVFIGPQASGKSVIVKLIHFFKSIFQEMENFLSADQNSIEDFSKTLHAKFLNYFPDKFWGNKDFVIEYIFSENNQITLHGNHYGKIKIKFSNEIIHFYDEANRSYKTMGEHFVKDVSPNLFELYNKFMTTLRSSPLWRENPIFIPGGRAFFSIFQENIFRFLSSNPSFDPFFKSFGKFYESLRNKTEILYSEKDAVVIKLVKNLLQGKYEFKEGKGYIKLEDREVDLEHSSSGQQEVLPLVLTLQGAKAYPLCALIIEEPEAHLFPAAQKHITELIAAVFNSKENRADIFITTHSPYILTALNTLLYAGQIAKKIKDETKLNRIVPQILQMDFKDVSVWALDSKGKCKSVMNKKTGLIDAVIIDDVSNKIFEEFDKLAELDE